MKMATKEYEKYVTSKADLFESDLGFQKGRVGHGISSKSSWICRNLSKSSMSGSRKFVR
jgi:hypothetical protein